jgi:hypothetical protein
VRRLSCGALSMAAAPPLHRAEAPTLTYSTQSHLGPDPRALSEKHAPAPTHFAAFKRLTSFRPR